MSVLGPDPVSQESTQQQKIINGVNYEMLPESSVATQRTFKRQFFQKSTYSATTSQAICDFNTGAEYVNAKRSYLVFRVTADAQANFGVGGATNLIDRIVITSRSGTELSRIEGYNRYATKHVRYGCSRSFLEQFGESMGFTDDPVKLAKTHDQLVVAAPPADQDSNVFMIPLPVLSPFFEGDGNSLIPAQLAAGMRVEITWASDAVALVSGAAPTYEISDISFMLNTTTLVDQWQRQLNAESARDGLTYSYAEIHTTVSALPAGQTQSNIEVRKAVARALSAFVVPTELADDVTEDNMKSDLYDFTKVEWRLGSMYPTQQPITKNPEAYFQAQSMWDSDIMDCKRSNAVSYSSFRDSTAAGGVADGDAILAVSLERSDAKVNGVLNISGAPTNNSRSLAVDATTTSVSGKTMRLYMKHLRVAKVFLDNVTVSE